MSPIIAFILLLLFVGSARELYNLYRVGYDAYYDQVYRHKGTYNDFRVYMLVYWFVAVFSGVGMVVYGSMLVTKLGI